MGHTNSTPNIGLPQFIGTDKPTWLGDVNGAMSTIDTKVGSIDAAIATTDAKADNAVADASGAVTTATNAVTTAGNASTTATQANNLATQALTVANNTADLCTDQIVPDVTANKTAIGTLADLTTTAKDNLVDAINEVAQGGGGGSANIFDLAWTNSDITTGFTQQTVSLDLSSYESVLIEYVLSTTQPTYGATEILMSDTINYEITEVEGATVISRSASWNASGVTFARGVAGGSFDDTKLIPYKIYGIR